jgi:hypothetical protein
MSVITNMAALLIFEFVSDESILYRTDIHVLPGKLFTEEKQNSVACSPQANYTDRANAACLRS